MSALEPVELVNQIRLLASLKIGLNIVFKYTQTSLLFYIDRGRVP